MSRALAQKARRGKKRRNNRAGAPFGAFRPQTQGLDLMRLSITASAIALGLAAAPLLAQSMTPQDVGASPMTGTAPQDYVNLAADSDMYEIQSSKLALSKSKSDQVKGFAREMIADHTTTTKSLMAGVKASQNKVKAPPTSPSADTKAKLAALRSASADQFDQLYLQQQAQAHTMAWSLHKGFADSGSDPALQQVATSAVPIIEKHIQHVKMGGMAGM
jgi:putative membrane protein